MKVPNHTVKSAKDFFKDELKLKYDASELNQMLEIVFAHLFGFSKLDLILNESKEIVIDGEFRKIVEELKKNKPLAHVVGKWEFYGLNFCVNKFTLIPRPETEELVDLILKQNTTNAKVLDIGTGTGCIPIALKANNYLYDISACDISQAALDVAKKNAEINKVEITFFEYDILKECNNQPEHKYDIIVSNPPYITEKEKSLMQANVLDYEPHLALFVDDESPLLFYNAISCFAKHNLKEGGKLYFEINEHFGIQTAELLKNKGFKNVNIAKDINTKDRIVIANL